MNRTTAIREILDPSEAPLAAALAAETFPDACPAWLEREHIDAFIADSLSPYQFGSWISQPDDHVLVAEADGAMLGYATVLHGVHTDEAPLGLREARTAYLSKLYLRRTARGTGAAAALLDAAVSAARADGCAAMFLGVNRENLRAQAFYGRSGFRAAGVRRFTVGGHSFEDLVLALPLG